MRKLFAALAAVVMIWSLTGCSDVSTARVYTGDTIYIGITAEATGWAQPYGEPLLNGAMLAVNEINNAGGVRGGKPLQLVQLDNGSNSTRAMTMTTQTMGQHRALATIAPATDQVASALGSVGDAREAAIVAPTVITDPTGDSSSSYFFQPVFSAANQARAVAQWCRSREITRVAVIVNETDHVSSTLRASFVENFSDDQHSVVAEATFDAGQEDFAAVIAALDGLDYQAIYVPAMATEGARLVNQVRQAGVEAPIIGSHTWDVLGLAEIAGAEQLNEVFIPTSFTVVPQDNAQAGQFISSYRDEYHVDPTFYAAKGYDAVKIIASAVNNAENLSGTAVRDAVASTHSFDGAAGSISMDGQRSRNNRMLMVRYGHGAQTDYEVVEI